MALGNRSALTTILLMAATVPATTGKNRAVVGEARLAVSPLAEVSFIGR
jgi:hypothetical protein